jgi:hypothetical protein
MSLLLRPAAKPVKYKSDDEDDDTDYSPRTKNTNNNNNPPTPKRKNSGSADGEPVVVKREKLDKSKPALPKVNDLTDLESQYAGLDAGEKKAVGGKKIVWTDEEHNMIVFGIWKKLDNQLICDNWPQSEYPRSNASIKKRSTEIRNDLRSILSVSSKDTTPVKDEAKQAVDKFVPEMDGMLFGRITLLT